MDITLLIKTDNKELSELYSKITNTGEDSGFDLYIPDELVIKPGPFKINHQIKCEMVKLIRNVYGAPISTKNIPFLMMPRSSISKTRLICHNSFGLIDKGYRGILYAPVINIGKAEQKVDKHNRLFQIINFSGEPFNVRVVNYLSESKRGEKGLGSTGK